MSKQKTALVLLRLGLAFVFFYTAVASFLNPNDWIGFFPIFLRNFFGVNFVLTAFSFYELILGFWLLSGKFQFYSAILSALTILGIIVFNIGAFDIVFRDVGLFFAALALAGLNREERLRES